MRGLTKPQQLTSENCNVAMEGNLNSYELGRKHETTGLPTWGREFLKLLDSMSNQTDDETGLSERESYLLGRLDECASRKWARVSRPSFWNQIIATLRMEA